MAIEIEHKFLLANDDWRKATQKSIKYKQGYLSSQPTSSIRIRISDKQAWLNIKSATIGTQRLEFEYEIPLTDAQEIIATLCGKPLIEKTRHLVPIADNIWEIDEFEGDNHGLIVAEIELSKAGQNFTKPHWLGVEVTHDLRYYNNNLSVNPYKNWGNK
ncbi:CYTH domain-containing protein [Methyloglobulus sp.]|uniref:CYTH domain-containing protein n=1 Tax=Methyloglobulus sp. TaxID=2518622 RepID=UPI0017F58A98|nr:CYTH domain-containing protein [Methyloglobulus sp.]